MIYSLPLLIAGDHAGFLFKKKIIQNTPHYSWRDLGPDSSERTDYPIWAEKLCRILQPRLFGVLICGTGQGMFIKANRYSHIRAALCLNPQMARKARSHNDANVLCLGSRLLSLDEALEILRAFLTTDFNRDDPAHARRVKQLAGFYRNTTP